MEVCIKAWFPFYQSTISTLEAAQHHLAGCRSGNSSDKRALKEVVTASLNQLKNQQAAFETKIEGDYLVFDRFTVSVHEWAGTGESEIDGVSTADRVQGFLVEVFVPFKGSEGQSDGDPVEIGKYTHASSAAMKVLEFLFHDIINNAMHAEAEAKEFEAMRKDAEEVF